MTGLRLLFRISIGFCLLATSCGSDTLSSTIEPAVCFEELPAGPTCEALCERVVAECDAFPGVTTDACIQGCECELQATREISDECGEAQEAGFLCTSELNCQGVLEFFSPGRGDDFPCRGAVLDIEAACEG